MPTPSGMMTNQSPEAQQAGTPHQSEQMPEMDWSQPETELSLEAMDQLVQQYTEKRKLYEAKKLESAEAYHLMEDAEKLVTDALVAAGKKKYFVDGIGTVSLATKSSFKTPKSPEEKQLLFKYISEKYGPETLLDYLSIHSASLNSFAGKELETDPLLVIPGLGTPTINTELRFRKD